LYDGTTAVHEAVVALSTKIDILESMLIINLSRS